jgi:hypothetical protein
VDKKPYNMISSLSDQESFALEPAKDYELPARAELRRRGTSFQRHYIASAMCTPSRGATFSGQPPQVNGVFDRMELGYVPSLPRDEPSMSKAMKDLGYQTAYSTLRADPQRSERLRLEDLPSSVGVLTAVACQESNVRGKGIALHSLQCVALVAVHCRGSGVGCNDATLQRNQPPSGGPPRSSRFLEQSEAREPLRPLLLPSSLQETALDGKGSSHRTGARNRAGEQKTRLFGPNWLPDKRLWRPSLLRIRVRGEQVAWHGSDGTVGPMPGLSSIAGVARLFRPAGRAGCRRCCGRAGAR